MHYLIFVYKQKKQNTFDTLIQPKTALWAFAPIILAGGAG